MNNDLEQLSEKRLRLLTDYSGTNAELQWGEIEALARIALAAKQAKPFAYYANDAYYNTERAALKDGAEEVTTLYATPQPAHTEQDGCQWIPDEDSVYSTGCGNEWQFTDGGLEDNQIKFCPYCSGKIAAPKPESE